MTLEVLVATMNQDSFSLIEQMNISGAAIIANQTNRNCYQETNNHGHVVKMVSSMTKGVGINRNIALLNSTADILLFADDDEVLSDGYIEHVISAFEKNKKADIIAFGITYTKNGEVYKTKCEEAKRKHIFNGLGYGAARLAIRRTSFLTNNIWFSHLFGGGCIYCSGEDTLFLAEAFKKKMKVYSDSFVVCKTRKDESSWFSGFDEKYFFDDGASIAAANIWGIKYLYMIYHSLKKEFNDKNDLSIRQKYHALYSGYKSYYLNKSYLDWKNEGS